MRKKERQAIEGADFFIRLVPFPPGPSHGVTFTNPDGTFSMYLDANADDETLMRAYWHEYAHIANGDFDAGTVLEEIEDALHQMPR